MLVPQRGYIQHNPVKWQWLWPMITHFSCNIWYIYICISPETLVCCYFAYCCRSNQTLHLRRVPGLWSCTTLYKDSPELYLPPVKLLDMGNLTSFLSKTVDNEKTIDAHLDSYNRKRSNHNSICLAEFIVKEYFNKWLNVWHFSEKDSKTFIQLLLSALTWPETRSVEIWIFKGNTVHFSHSYLLIFWCMNRLMGHTLTNFSCSRGHWLYLNLSGTLTHCNRNWTDLNFLCWVLAWAIMIALCECHGQVIVHAQFAQHPQRMM